MKIIVGLGTPGRKYERTRHNAGFMAIDQLADNLHADVAQEKFFALIGKVSIDSEPVVLVKPQTYMNESGRAVAAAARASYADVSDLLVIHDDLDLPAGSVRVKVGGGHGGHNGLRSIIEHLGSADFIRVRIGIGRPALEQDAADYVLSPFLPEEREAAAKAVSRALEAVNVFLKEGPAAAMNKFNQR